MAINEFIIMSNTQKNWTIKMFKCCNNPYMCAFSCLVPFSCSIIQCLNSKLIFPETQEYLGAYFCTWFCCIGLAYNRSNLRKRLNIEGNYCLDCICHTCCSYCSLTQEWQEVMFFRFKNTQLNIFNYNPYQRANATS
jgi:Cys-rich protein (TIGR01571 family)